MSSSVIQNYSLALFSWTAVERVELFLLMARAAQTKMSASNLLVETVGRVLTKTLGFAIGANASMATGERIVNCSKRVKPCALGWERWRQFLSASSLF